MAAAKLPKAERAVIAAHEAGMHDKVAKPDACRECAKDLAELKERLAAKKAEPAPKRRTRNTKAETELVQKLAKSRGEQVKKLGLTTEPKKRRVPPDQRPIPVPEPEPTPAPEPEKKRVKVTLDTPVKVIEEATLTEEVGVIEVPVYTSREAWLAAAVEAMTPWFEEHGHVVPRVYVSVGWPAGRSAKSNTIGQCFYAVADGSPALFISPVLTDPVTVLATLVHEVAHAVVGPTAQAHRGAFVKVSKAVGLVGPWTATGAGEELAGKLRQLAEKLGVYTHSKVTKSVRPTVQTTRMLKVVCSDCECVVRMTRKWLDEVGAPTCGCGGDMAEAGGGE